MIGRTFHFHRDNMLVLCVVPTLPPLGFVLYVFAILPRVAGDLHIAVWCSLLST